MRAIFGVVSLLLVLAIVGLVARKQLQSVNALPAPAGVANPAGAAPQERSQQMQQRVQQDVQRALQQGAERASEAQP